MKMQGGTDPGEDWGHEFFEWWTRVCAEWEAIKTEMLDAGKSPSAHDVTTEQYRRMNARGESPFEARRRIAEFLKRGV